MGALMLIFAVMAADTQDTARIAELFRSASKWRVGEAIGEVDSARKELIGMGKIALDYIFSQKMATTSTLEYRAIKSVVKGLRQDAKLYIQNCLRSDNDTVLVNCLRLIGDIKDTAFGGDVERFLDESYSGRVRRTAAFALGRLKYRDAFPRLARCVHDTSFRMRLVAVPAAAETGGKDAVPLLTDVALNDEFFLIRMEAAHALAKSAPDDGLKAALDAIDTTHDHDARVRSLQMVDVFLRKNRYGGALLRRARHILIELSNDDDPVVRGYAVRALGNIMDGNVRTALSVMLAGEENLFVVSQLEEALADSCDSKR